MSEQRERKAVCFGTLESCPWREQIVEHSKYEKNVIASLARLESKMDLIVGPDGNNGRLGTAEDAIDSLKQTRSRDRGFAAALITAWTIAVALFDHFIRR